MKRILILLGILGFIGVFAFAFIYQYMKANKSTTPISEKTLTPSPSPTQVTKQEKTVSYNNERFAYSYFIVQNPANLSLIPNFSHPKDAQTLIADNACVSTINGGFYDTAGKPLGFFYANNRTLGQEIHSTLLNGFFWADTYGVALISTELPRIPFRFTLQTGPLLLFNGQTMALTIQNDEHARRMVVGKTTDNHFIFLAVYSRESVYSGPLLSDLPSVVFSISSEENLGIVDALNLDGGSASAFYNGETRLSELTPVGSLFCVK